MSLLQRPAKGWRDCHLRPDRAGSSRTTSSSFRLQRAGWPLDDGLLDGVRTATVDKSRGREASVLINSTATSIPDDIPRDIPRDMSHFFSLNRFNVATSRARALVVLVCNPALLTVSCKTPEQMRLANAMARFVELAGAA